MKKSLLLTAAFTAVTVGINAQPFADGVRNFCNHKFDARAVASVGVKAKAARHVPRQNRFIMLILKACCFKATTAMDSFGALRMQ